MLKESKEVVLPNETFQPEDKEKCLSSIEKKTIIHKNAIKTFCRLRPNDNPEGAINISITNNGANLVITEDQIRSDLQRSTYNQCNNNIYSNSNAIQQPIETNFNFTKVFDVNYTQKGIYTEICCPMIDDLLAFKRSGLIFTYGLSNSGKTHTIIGTADSSGILPLSLVSILQQVEEKTKYKEANIAIECSYVEIYNEEIFDLLSPNKSKVHLKEKDKLFYLTDNIVKTITSLKDFNIALNDGMRRKIHSSTKLNPQSSRSHTVFKIIAKGKDDQSTSLSIVDLAGAERSVRTETKGKELYQAGKINQSLMILGRCIDAMEWNTRHVHGDKKIPVPIRESKLTKMFQEYFTGEQNVSMIATINLNKDDLAENKNVLSFACKAKQIQPIKSWVTVSRKINNKNNLNTNKDNEGATMIMSGYKSDSSADLIDITKSYVPKNDDNQFDRLNDQYSSLVNRYENTLNEAEYYKDKNDALIQKLFIIDNEYSVREEKTMKANQEMLFIQQWDKLFNTNYPRMKMKQINFVFPNPLYKKDEEMKINLLKTSNNNLEIIQKKTIHKTFKEIADSFSIASMDTSSTVTKNMDDSQITTKKKKKKKTKNSKNKGYWTNTSVIEEEEDDEETETFSKKQRNKRRKKNNDSDCEMENDSISNESERKSNNKKTKKKQKKNMSISRSYTSIDDDNSENESLIKVKKTKAKRTKKKETTKGKKYANERSIHNDKEDNHDEDNENDIEDNTNNKKKTKGNKEIDNEINELRKQLRKDKNNQAKRKKTKSKMNSLLSIDNNNSQDSFNEHSLHDQSSEKEDNSDSEEKEIKTKQKSKKAKAKAHSKK